MLVKHEYFFKKKHFLQPRTKKKKRRREEQILTWFRKFLNKNVTQENLGGLFCKKKKERIQILQIIVHSFTHSCIHLMASSCVCCSSKTNEQLASFSFYYWMAFFFFVIITRITWSIYVKCCCCCSCCFCCVQHLVFLANYVVSWSIIVFQFCFHFNSSCLLYQIL